MEAVRAAKVAAEAREDALAVDAKEGADAKGPTTIATPLGVTLVVGVARANVGQGIFLAARAITRVCATRE